MLFSNVDPMWAKKTTFVCTEEPSAAISALETSSDQTNLILKGLHLSHVNTVIQLKLSAIPCPQCPPFTFCCSLDPQQRTNPFLRQWVLPSLGAGGWVNGETLWILKSPVTKGRKQHKVIICRSNADPRCHAYWNPCRVRRPFIGAQKLDWKPESTPAWKV